MAVSLEKKPKIYFDWSNIAIHNHTGTSSGGLTIANTAYRHYSPIDNVLERIETIEERLAIIVPNEILHDKYPALKEAYDAYKLIEQLVKDQHS